MGGQSGSAGHRAPSWFPFPTQKWILWLLHEAPAPALQPVPTWPPGASFIQHLEQHCHWLWILYRLVCTFLFFSYKLIGIQTCIKNPQGVLNTRYVQSVSYSISCAKAKYHR